MKFNKEYVLNTLKEILSVDSPSGYTDNVIQKLKELANETGNKLDISNCGMGIISVNGISNEKTIGIATHIDTLGLMVKSITDNGRLKISRIGGPIYPTLDSELCKIYTRDGKVYEGTIFSTSPSAHVYKDVNTVEKNDETLEVVLDEIVKNKQDVINLGINNGDFIAIDPKTVITKNDFIKSRFLDDKLSVAIVLGVLKYFKDNNIIPKYNIKFLFSVYEEVGHGTSYIPTDISELISVDMGCIGKDLSCTEMDVSICAKDASGPYDYNITNEFINIAKLNNLKYAVDVYTFYSSDVSVALKSGNDIKGALIGPGVFASHGYERSHYSAVENTMKLLVEYLK